MPKVLATTLLALVLAPLAGCGATGGAARVVVTPMTPEEEALYDNGADLIDDPDLLDGPALEEWESTIEGLCASADVVVVVRITAVQTSTDLDRRISYRLVGAVELERFGDVEDHVSLIVREGEPGYQSIRRAEPHLLQQQFLVWIRWAETDAGVVARWHMSPAGDRVSRRANSLLERRRPAEERRRVIVHDRRESSGDDD